MSRSETKRRSKAVKGVVNITEESQGQIRKDYNGDLQLSSAI